MNPLRITLIVAGVILAFVAVVAAGGAYSANNDWAAKVDGREISESDFLAELEQLQNNPAAQSFGIPDSPPGSVASGVSAAWLARSVQNTIVELELERREIEVTDQHLAQAETEVVQQFGGPEAWEGFDAWFQAREIQRLAELLALSEGVGGTATEEQLREEFEANKEQLTQACTSHILVETQELAAEIKAQLEEGDDFAELAQEHSIDTNSAQNGGEVGCFARGAGLVASYEAAMFSLDVGEISDPVQSQFGFHIIRLDALEEPTFEEARPQLEQSVQGQTQQRFAEVMGQVLSEAEIEVNPKYGSVDLEDPAGRFVTPPSIPTVPDSLPVGGDEPVDGGSLELTP